MSFEINGPSKKPMIQESQNMQNNGGGGNLGYFKREKEKNTPKKQNQVDLFETNEQDSFEHEIQIEQEQFFKQILGWFKNIFYQIRHFFSEKKNPFV